MPAYATIEFTFRRSALWPTCVREFYSALRAAGLGFQGVLAWGCSGDLTLDDITAWNQAKLDAGFRLGSHEHVSNDYRQILLEGSPFSHCRVFLLNSPESYSFHMIVPEKEETDSRWTWLRSVAEHVWRALPVAAIQTYGEMGGGKSLRGCLKSQPRRGRGHKAWGFSPRKAEKKDS